MIYPPTTGFHWRPLDFQWYIKACKSRPVYAQNKTGFHDVNQFINLPPHDKSGFQSIPEFVKMTIDKKTSELKSPLQVAKILHNHAAKAIDIVDAMNAGENNELKVTLHSIKAMAFLGEYNVLKITGSTQLALYRAKQRIKNIRMPQFLNWEKHWKPGKIIPKPQCNKI